jgi:hypothetical protein
MGCWICTTLLLPPSASKQLVAFVRAISKKRPQINYGIGAIAAKGSFSANGSYSPPKGSDGLTCATFVVEVFRAVAIPLMDYSSWPAGTANVSWGNSVCTELQRTGAEADHVDAVRKNIGGLRVRPYEVVGAAMLSPNQRPASYTDVQPGATSADTALNAICPSTLQFVPVSQFGSA